MERLQHPLEPLGRRARPRGSLKEFSPVGTVWAGVQNNEPLFSFSKEAVQVAIVQGGYAKQKPGLRNPANRLFGLGLRADNTPSSTSPWSRTPPQGGPERPERSA